MKPATTVHVRYMVDDVAAALDFYTTHLGFTPDIQFPPAFADAYRGNLRLLLSGPASSAGRPMPDGVRPGPGGWNRIHLIVHDLESEVTRLKNTGVPFRNEIVTGAAGSQILIQDPAGNVIELFQPAAYDDESVVSSDLRRSVSGSRPPPEPKPKDAR